jgi:hypothetical protein
MNEHAAFFTAETRRGFIENEEKLAFHVCMEMPLGLPRGMSTRTHSRTDIFFTPGCCVKERSKPAHAQRFGRLVSLDVEGDRAVVLCMRTALQEIPPVWIGTVAEYTAVWEGD